MTGLLQRSLKTRITLFSLLIFVLSLWALNFYVSKILRADMEQLLGDQQLSTVALVAAHIDQELKERLTALENIAADFDEKELKSPATLQETLERRPILPLLFNGGYYVTDAAGIITASVPVAARRIGINHILSNHVAAALGEGKSVIGAVMIGKALQVPVFNMAVPIRGVQGKVVGSLVGVINLSSDNFLDRITSKAYGRTGGYLLVSQQQRMIVTATDKGRVMEILPPTGVSPAIDNFLAGGEGSAIFRNPKGVEVLVSARNIPVAGWYVAALLPTAEAFAPTQDMQQHMLLATILLTLISSGLTWWMLRRQLAPIGAAAAAIGARLEHDLKAAPLPVTTRDEIGQLISSFNSLLVMLASREQALRASESRFSLFMEHLPGVAFIKDDNGNLLYANRTMKDLIGTSAWEGKAARDFFPPEMAEKMIADDLRAMAAGNVIVEEDLPAPDGRLRHYETHKFRIPTPGQVRLLGGIGLDISVRKQAEDALQRTVKDLRETQRIAHIGSWHLDLASNQVVWTEELYKMYGFDPSQPVPPYPEHMKLFTPDSWQRLSSALAHTRETGVPYTLELELVRKDGNNGWMWVHGEVEVDAAGKTVGLWGAAQDITERRRIEVNIRLAEARFKAIIEASPIPFALNDSALNITYLNSAFVRTFGYDRKDIPTLEAWWPKAYPDEMYRQEVAKEWLLRLDVARRDATSFEPMEVKIVCKDGRVRTVLATATPLTSGIDDLHVVTLYDITERKATESLLHGQLDELQRWQQAMLGRESRIISMKQEVNELLARSGQPPRYVDQRPADPGPGVGQTPAEQGGRDA